MAIAAVLPLSGALVMTGMATVAQAAVISSYDVRGNQRVDDDTIATYLTIKPGKQFGAAEIDDSIKVLFDTGLFADVDIDRSGSVLIVTVVENPIINSIEFLGNKKIKSEILIQVVVSEARGMLTDARIQTDLVRIREHYARNGRSGVIVDVDITELSNNRVNITYVIDEGDRTGIGSISFVGNNAFSKARLRRVINMQTSNVMSWFNKRDLFSDERLAADREALRRHYLKYGYADFQILSADATFDAETGKYHVVFTLEEGPKYRFGNVMVDSSIPGVDPEALRSIVRTNTGDVFNANKVETSVEALTIELSRLGFVFAQVRPRGDRNYVDNVIDLTYVVDEGPRAYVERIEIRGNTKTRDYVIRREFDISEGDAYNRVMIDKAERRLRNLNFFEFVQIRTQVGSAPDKVVVVVYVQDKSTGSISAAAGVSTDQGLIGEIALEERNFLGRGQTLRIAFGGGTEDQQYNLGFTDPYFLGNRMSAGFDLFKTTSNAGNVRPYAVEKLGGGLRLGLPLTDDAQVTVRYKGWEETTSGATGATATLFPNSSRFVSTLGYTAIYSTLDSNLNPSDGVRLKLQQDFAGLGGDAQYVKTEIDARYYRPIVQDSDIVGMLRVGAGNVTGIGQDVSLFDSFYQGGETVRGFATRGFGPRDAGVGGTGHAVGGKHYISGTAEIQFPFPALPPDFGLRGAVFADAGLLWGVDTPSGVTTIVDNNSIRSSIGGSLLWASPFGLIRADMAHVLTKEDFDETQFFRIGAGTSF